MSAEFFRFTIRLATSLCVVSLIACQALPVRRISSVPGQPGQPEPTIATVAAPLSTDLREAHIDAVNVEIGLGSPLPVTTIVSGNWPNTCAQLGELGQSVEKPEFRLTLMAADVPGENCVDDSLPFRMSIPLNLTGFSAGTYTVTVNGAQAIFDFPVPFQQDATIEQVEVQVAESMPVQANATVRGQFPDACWQLDSVTQARDGNTFRLIPMFKRSSADMCMQMITPFEQTVTLDTTGLAAGTYQVVVNDVSVANVAGGTYTVLMLPVGTTFELTEPQ